MRAVFTRFAQTLRDGFSLFWLAPLIVALIVVPEFIQHIAEFRIGMFESEVAFKSLSADPRRMVWGYLKIAGLFLSLFSAVRYWGARGHGGKWWDLRGIAWKNFGIAFGLMIATAIPGALLAPVIGAQNGGHVDLVLALVTLPLIALLVAGLIGDKDAGLMSVFKTGWLTSLRIVVFAAAVWIPLQWLHSANHNWAMGQSDAIVWALMIFDSLVVGALAALVGTAIHHAYTLHGTPRDLQGTPL